MKTLLNLLSEEKKNAVQKRIRRRFLMWQLFLLFVLEVFYFSILVGTDVVLGYQLKGLNSLGDAIPAINKEDFKRLALYEKKFQETNQLVATVSRIDHGHLRFFKLFAFLDPLIPQGIKLEHVATNEYQVTLSGEATTRENLIDFNDRLKNAGACIHNANIPISNLFSQKDIEFEATFIFDQTCLKD